jgi:RNA polymerase sigma-70 factor (ECF subfamily)
MENSHDEDLMLSVAQGDLNAFNEIILRHQRTAWGIAYRFLGDAAEAEDIAQQAFLKILEAASGYRPTAAFRTYLHQIVTRLCIDHTKKKRPTYTDTLPETQDHSTDPTHPLAMKERTAAISKALDILPSNQRLALILRHYEEMSYVDIAQSLKISVKAVEGLIRRARATLKTRLFSL